MNASFDKRVRASWVFRGGMLLVVLAGLTGGQAAADDMYWSQPLGGLFNLAANWDPQQVPGADDSAVFNLGMSPAYQVTFNTSISNVQCRIHIDTVDMALNGATYTLSPGLSLSVGQNWGDFGILSLAGGQVDAENVSIAGWEGSSGELTLGANLTMTLTGVMMVADSGYGALFVNDDATLETRAMDIGIYPSSSGAAFVSGEDAMVSVTEDLFVGEEGIGVLRIDTGGTVEVGGVVLAGYLVGGTGNIIVTDAGSELSIPDGDIIIGDWEGGIGSLDISAGGTVTANVAIVGSGALGSGEAVLIDSPSRLTVGDYMDVGTEGPGDLQVLEGAVLETDHLAFGATPLGFGSALVSGEDALVTSAVDLNVGLEGGGVFTIEAGGVVEVTETIRVAWIEGSNGYLTVTDPTSSLSTTDGWLIVGDGSTGTLDVLNGATVTAAWVDVGHGEPSSGVALIADPDSQLSVTNDLVVGTWGTGELTVTNEAEVNAGQIFVGGNPGSDGTLTASGAGTHLISTESLRAGETGHGVISISEGAAGSAVWVRLGYGEEGNGSVSVSGPDASLEVSNNVEVGVYGHGALDLHLGGAVTANTIFAGWTQSGEGELDLTGDGTNLTVNDTLYLGEYGQGEMFVGDEASATIAWLRVGQSSSGEGTLGLFNLGSTVNVTEDARIGNTGIGELHVDDQAEFHTVNPSGWIVLGEQADSFGRALVENGGLLSADLAPIVLASAGEAWMSIMDGGQVYSDGELFAGGQAGGEGYLDIAGAGSRYESNSVYPTKIGDWGSAYVSIWSDGVMQIRSGALLAMQEGSVGDITLNHPGSLLDVPVLLVGRKGTAQLTINDGRVAMGVDPASVPAGELHLGPGAELGGTGTISGKVVNESGIVWPGGTVGSDIWSGTLSLTGDLEQYADGALYTELGGTVASAEYCVLAVSGTAELDGELRILPVSDFVPEEGQEFEILTAGSVTGEFTSLTADGRWCVAYEPTRVTVALAEPGDCNEDCAVDLDDITWWSDCMAGPGVAAPGGCECADADEDGDVDLADYAEMQRRFGGA